MPLVRLKIRNELALGAPELYREANKEDPKHILEGVAVAGLVGVLRQLGDLAEFAADVFHGLQEEVTITSSRSHKLIAHVQRIEAALPPLEKAILAQRNHLHYAYTAGINWHTHFQLERNHFICSDVPQFIMDSYEVCREPPRLHLLDRFEPGGPGSCLKKYSDPTFFKKESMASGEVSLEKSSREKKGQQIKKRKLWPSSRDVSRGASFSFDSDRKQFTQLNFAGNQSLPRMTFTHGARVASKHAKQFDSDLGDVSNQEKGNLQLTYPIHREELESGGSISHPATKNVNDYLEYNFLDHKVTNLQDDVRIFPSVEQAKLRSSSVTCDENIETFGGITLQKDSDNPMLVADHNRNTESLFVSLDLESRVVDEVNLETLKIIDPKPCIGDMPGMRTGDILLDDVDSETDQFSDALNTIEVEYETDINCSMKKEGEQYSILEDEGSNDRPFEPHNSDYQFSNSLSNVSADSSQSINSHESDPIYVPCRSNTKILDKSILLKVEKNSNLVDEGENDRLLMLRNYNLDFQHSNTGSNVSADSSLINGSCEHDPNFVAYRTTCDVKSNIELNSCHQMDEDFQRDLKAWELFGTGSLLKVDSVRNVVADNSTTVGYISHPTSICKDEDSFVPVNDGRTSSESPLALPGNSNVKSLRNVVNDNSTSVECISHPTSDCKDEDLLVSVNDGSSSSEFQVSLPESSIVKSFQNVVVDNSTTAGCISHPTSNCKENSLVPLTDGRSISESLMSQPDNSNVKSIQNDVDNSSTVGCISHPTSKCEDENSVVPVNDGRSSSESQISLPENSNVKPVMFWTNGGLLGLQPSKPPDWSLSNGLQQDHLSKEDGNTSNISRKISPSNLEIKLGNAGNSLHRNNGSSTATSRMNLEHQENSVGSQVIQLRGRSLATGSGRKLLHGVNENTISTNFQPSWTVEQRKYQSPSHHQAKGMDARGSPIRSPSASPPLEHMKISFQPIDGFGISKLKLKIPDRNYSNESSSGIFPSFQLVPEVCNTPQNDTSESDDDSLYRSSPSFIDGDCPSHPDSNSEQWVSGQSPVKQEADLYDAFNQITLTEPAAEAIAGNVRGDIAVSCKVRFPHVENKMQSAESCHCLNFQRMDTGNWSLVEEPIKLSNSPNFPIQWPGNSDAMELECLPMYEASKYAFVRHSQSTISQLPNPAPLNQDQLIETPDLLNYEHLGFLKSNVKREDLSKSVEENDFLRQIRTKSFNLRPTVTTKPSVISGGNANVQVTAILEKANAVRQAVSDDEDSWSDP